MSLISRIIIAVAALSLIATYFLPVWGIYLIAPQYPEGLEMQIWLNRITGEVDIINGLNHYIGMKKISAEMFPEFGFLVYVMGFLILSGLAVAFSGKIKLLLAYLALLGVGAVAALADFYLWGYDYGHNLDPTAPIQVTGFSYQPPVIGHKKLLNFDAYSYPESGGWVVVAAGLAFFIIWLLERKKKLKMKATLSTQRISVPAVCTSLLLLLAGCTPKAEEIAYGKDQCNECKMTIMDAKFGGEIVSKKGRVFKFDDAHCMASFLERRRVELSNIHLTLVKDFNASGSGFLTVSNAHFVIGSKLKSPMGSNAAAFANKAAAETKAVEVGGKVTDWPTLYNIIK